RVLFAACAADATPAGKRDAAILAVLYGCGLRRAELVDLDVDDYDPETGAFRVMSGKGNKARLSYSSQGSRAAVDAWLVVRGAASLRTEGPLFCPINKGGKLAMRRMTDQAVRKILRKRARE